MGSLTKKLDEAQIEFIGRQKLFFTATAPTEGGHINLSPKGSDSFRVISESEAVYLDLTGSGNETAAHLGQNGRLTIMFCSFEEKPLILRLYGTGRTIQKSHADWDKYMEMFGGAPAGLRQFMVLKITAVQGSCGFAVPFYDYTGERKVLDNWASKKGDEELTKYRETKNKLSLDGLPTNTDF